MTHRLTHDTTISAGIAPEMSRQPSSGVLVLSDDELARVSGGDSSPISVPVDVTLNCARTMQRAAYAEDAYLPS